MLTVVIRLVFKFYLNKNFVWSHWNINVELKTWGLHFSGAFGFLLKENFADGIYNV